MEAVNPDGTEAEIGHWDPDCFKIGEHYYAISGGQTLAPLTPTGVPLLRSADLKNWTHIGNFLSHELPDVTIGEDISCANFFPLGHDGKWVLLCIAHMQGCRYYIGEWDAEAEQFVPETHGRMNWRREDQGIWGQPPWRVDYFAPESVLTTDGRRVMWAWLATLGKTDDAMDRHTVQSLPRELSLPADGILRINPLTEVGEAR